jgi:hypothetical protein
MAEPNIKLIEALRETALRLRNGAYYAWGHHGGCNCGNLLQVVTQHSKEEILKFAHTGIGEWTELSEDYCPVNDKPVDYIVSQLCRLGLTTSDIHNLEYLEDREVLENLPGGFRWLQKNMREDVIVYFGTFADLLERKLAQKVKLNYKETKNSMQPEFTQA